MKVGIISGRSRVSQTGRGGGLGRGLGGGMENPKGEVPTYYFPKFFSKNSTPPGSANDYE